MAEQTYSSRNYTVLDGETTAKHDSHFCHPYTSVYFETHNGFLIPYIVNAALNITSAIVTTFANVLVFLAVRRTTSIRLPSKLLLCSLVLTDLGVGLVVQPQYAMFLIMKVRKAHSLACFFLKSEGFAGSMFTGVSLLTMTAIGLDRYAALFHHFKYHEIVSTRRVSAVLAIIFLSAVFCASVSLWNKVLWVLIISLGISICFLVNSMAFNKIYRTLRLRYGHQVHDEGQLQQQAGSTLNVATYRRTASTMLCIYVFLVLCYFPYFCVYIINLAVRPSALIRCIFEFFYTLMLLNSCFNPFVYCFRLPEIRAEVLKQLRKCCGQSPSQAEVDSQSVEQDPTGADL